jgi:hypothetical protein
VVVVQLHKTRREFLNNKVSGNVYIYISRNTTSTHGKSFFPLRISGCISGIIPGNERLYRHDLPLHQASRQTRYQKHSPDALTPPSGSYSPSLSLGTGRSAHCLRLN